MLLYLESTKIPAGTSSGLAHTSCGGLWSGPCAVYSDRNSVIFPGSPYSCWGFLYCFVGNMADVDDDDDPNRWWCAYRQPVCEDKFMICCDCCHEWYHGECVGISVSQGNVMSRDNEEYVYPLWLSIFQWLVYSVAFPRPIPCLFPVRLLLWSWVLQHCILCV